MRTDSLFGGLVLTLLLGFSGSTLDAQEEYWQLKLRGDSTISGFAFQRIDGDSVVAVLRNGTFCIPLQSLLEIRVVKQSKVGGGAAIGAGVGAVAGGIAGVRIVSANRSDGAFIMLPGGIVLLGALAGGAVGALIGGTVGAIAGVDRVYDLSTMNLNEKRMAIQQIISRSGGG